MRSGDRIGVARRLIAGTGGRQTRPRIEALVALLEAGRTVSHADLHRRLPALDRVSLYRALDWLVEHRLAHRAADGDGIRRYGPSLPQDDHRHPHFHCTNCGLTTCLEAVAGPQVILPGGFTGSSVEVLVRGLCRTCSATGG